MILLDHVGWVPTLIGDEMISRLLAWLDKKKMLNYS